MSNQNVFSSRAKFAATIKMSLRWKSFWDWFVFVKKSSFLKTFRFTTYANVLVLRSSVFTMAIIYVSDFFRNLFFFHCHIYISCVSEIETSWTWFGGLILGSNQCNVRYCPSCLKTWVQKWTKMNHKYFTMITPKSLVHTVGFNMLDLHLFDLKINIIIS